MSARFLHLKMLLATVILAFVLTANGLDCVWLKNEQGAGKLTSLMKSSSGPAQFHLNKANSETKYIEIHLFDNLEADMKNMAMMINIGKVVQQTDWVNFDNLDLNVLFTSSNTTKTSNQTKYLSYSLQANISFHPKVMLAVNTSEGSFIFNFKLSDDQATQNPSEALTIKQKQEKFESQFLLSKQAFLLYVLISVFIMGTDIIILQHYSKKTSFQLSRTASALYLQIIYFIEIFDTSLQNFQKLKLAGLIIIQVLGIAALAKVRLIFMKLVQDGRNPTLREIIERGIIIVISFSFIYSLYFLVVVYCIIRDTQVVPQMKYTSDLILLSRCKTIAIILLLPALKVIYGVPNGFPFDSAIFCWIYLFMLVYISITCEINYRGGFKTCIRIAKQVLSAKVRDYCGILKNREVNNGNIDKVAEEDSQWEDIDHQQCKEKKKYIST